MYFEAFGIPLAFCLGMYECHTLLLLKLTVDPLYCTDTKGHRISRVIVFSCRCPQYRGRDHDMRVVFSGTPVNYP